jgi:hypothetical protein
VISWYNANNTAYDDIYNKNATYRAEATKDGYFIGDPSYRDYPSLSRVSHHGRYPLAGVQLGNLPDAGH